MCAVSIKPSLRRLLGLCFFTNMFCFSTQKLEQITFMSPLFCFLKITHLKTDVCFLSLEPSIWSKPTFFLFSHLPSRHLKYVIMGGLLIYMFQMCSPDIHVFSSLLSSRKDHKISRHLHNHNPSFRCSTICLSDVRNTQSRAVYSYLRLKSRCRRNMCALSSPLLSQKPQSIDSFSKESTPKSMFAPRSFSVSQIWRVSFMFAVRLRKQNTGYKFSVSFICSKWNDNRSMAGSLFSLPKTVLWRTHGICLECWEIFENIPRNGWCFRLCSYHHIGSSAQNE